MAIELVPLPQPTSANASGLKDFGREVIGLHPGKLTPQQLKEVQEALYKVSCHSTPLPSTSNYRTLV